MAKHKTAKELMAERNPLARAAVAPVDIYSQPQPVEIKPQEETPPKSQTNKPKTPALKKKVAIPQDKADIVRPYSTYLRQSQVKGIKRRAVENDVKDQYIVQTAIDEYFGRNPL